MFFRMLKRDLKDKPGLNIILFIVMSFASVLAVFSATMLWMNFVGVYKDLEKVNASDATAFSMHDLDDASGKNDSALNWFCGKKEVTDAELSYFIKFDHNAVDFLGFNERSSSLFKDIVYFASDQSAKHNRVTDMNSRFFDLSYGEIAIPEYVHRHAKVNIGDKVRLTTQMGNVYEFKVAVITKDPGLKGIYRLFFNREDYEVIKNDSPVGYDVYMVDIKKSCDLRSDIKLFDEYTTTMEKSGTIEYYYAQAETYSVQETTIYVNALIVVFSALVIFMVFMTVNFTIRTAIKNEEKELGMLKAIGVDSTSFNWLFAAKYLAISFVGAIIGFCGGIPISKLYIKYVAFGQLEPSFTSVAGVALVAAVMSFVIIVISVAISLRRMKKISIIDVISGENRGERYRRVSGIFLHRLKHINIPFYLALTDLTNRIRRYKFLIFAYSFGMMMIIVTLEMHNTVYSTYWLEKHQAFPPSDFVLDLTNEQLEDYTRKSGGALRAYDLINEELKEAEIPAHVGYIIYSFGNATYGNSNFSCQMQYSYSPVSDIKLYKGLIPKLGNEVAISTFMARNHGINIGDTININYYKCTGDGISVDEVNEDFIVVGLVDVANGAFVYMGEEFEEASGYVYPGGGRIDAPKNMHSTYIEKMKEMYGETSVRTMDEQVEYILDVYDVIFKMYLRVFVPVWALMLILITILYQSINISDEKTEIAFLKCSGFNDAVIKRWQIIRCVMIVLISSIIAIVLVNTVALMFVRDMLDKLSLIVSYEPNRNIPLFYIGIPLVTIVVLAFLVYLSLRKVKDIKLSEIGW